MHQPLTGFLVEIEDVLHNIISRKTLNRPKEMNAVSTKVLLPFFPPVCTFAPSLFSQVGLTILRNTKRALILSCCTFSLYSFVNLPFTVFLVNILIMVSLLGAHCYNAYCTLLCGQFNIWQIAIFTTSHCQITIFTSPLLHCKLDKFTLFYGLPKIFWLSSKKSIDCPIF